MDNALRYELISLAFGLAIGLGFGILGTIILLLETGVI